MLLLYDFQLKILLKFRWQKEAYLLLEENNENVQNDSVCHVCICDEVLSECSSCLPLPILTFGVVALTFSLYSDNLSRNRSKINAGCAICTVFVRQDSFLNPVV